jgi:hypothetical protein
MSLMDFLKRQQNKSARKVFQHQLEAKVTFATSFLSLGKEMCLAIAIQIVEKLQAEQLINLHTNLNTHCQKVMQIILWALMICTSKI